VVSIPNELLQTLHMQNGSEVSVELDETGTQIVIKPKRMVDAGISPDFAQQVDEFINLYRPALESLAGK
jgi:antitoxin component of MazEF toxin-antitoxin module